MSADIGNVVNVSLLRQGASIARDNMNVVTIMTSDSTVLNSNERYRSYLNSSSLEADFGTNSEVFQVASALFGTTPNPTNSGGRLIIGYWRAVSENVDASAAVLRSEQLSEAVVIGNIQKISDGSFDIDVDGATVNVTDIDGRTFTQLSDIVSALNTAITGATVTESNSQIVITSDTTGVASTLTYASAGATGTFVGDLLGLSVNSGSLLNQGAAASVLPPETKTEAVSELKQLVNFKGCMYIDKPTDQEVNNLATWGQANDVLFYDVFSDPANLEINITNTVWLVKLNGQTYYRCLYDPSGNRKFAASYMGRMHTVNFNAENSALTMNMKELSGVTPWDATQTEIDKCQAVGLDIYVTFKNVPKVLTSGANDFTDNPYNFIAYVDAVQTDVFNLLGTTATKISQTTAGVNQIVDQCEKTTQGFVRANVFAPGTWTSPDRFGNVGVFNRSIEENGYYFLAGALADQPQPDREARKSPVIQGAVKNAGAIHKCDILINLNL